MTSAKKDFSSRFFETVGKPLKEDILLSEFSHFKIGGPADYFFEATSIPELLASLSLAREFQIPLYIIGGGTNILFSDGGYTGLR